MEELGKLAATIGPVGIFAVLALREVLRFLEKRNGNDPSKKIEDAIRSQTAVMLAAEHEQDKALIVAADKQAAALEHSHEETVRRIDRVGDKFDTFALRFEAHCGVMERGGTPERRKGDA